MKNQIINSKNNHNLLNHYYNNIFITELFFFDKYSIPLKQITYPLLYRNVNLFHLNGWVSKLSNKNGHLNQVIKMNCHMSKYYFTLYVPVQMPCLAIYLKTN